MRPAQQGEARRARVHLQQMELIEFAYSWQISVLRHRLNDMLGALRNINTSEPGHGFCHGVLKQSQEGIYHRITIDGGLSTEKRLTSHFFSVIS
jgi:hypothetical protein